MRAKIGTGGDIARQCGQAAGPWPRASVCWPQAQCDLAEEQGQAGEHAGPAQRRPGRGTGQQRLPAGERADATGQPHRQAIAMAEQHAQQQGDRHAGDRPTIAHNTASCSDNSNARPLRATPGLPAGRQPRPAARRRRQRGARHVRAAQGQRQASHGQRRAADQQSAVSAAREPLQVRQPGGIGGREDATDIGDSWISRRQRPRRGARRSA
jgi:hypothetical protein